MLKVLNTYNFATTHLLNPEILILFIHANSSMPAAEGC